MALVLTILYYSATCVLCGPALATAAVAAAETGQVLNGFAILPIPDGGQLGDYCNLANASACSALCNATMRCSGWSYTKAGRKACRTRLLLPQSRGPGHTREVHAAVSGFSHRDRGLWSPRCTSGGHRLV